VLNNSPPSGGVEALDAQHTLPVWLQAAGYRTSHIGKYLNGYGLRHAPDVPPGWSDWHAAVDKSTYQMYGYKLLENGTLHRYGDFDVEDPALYQTDVLRQKAVESIAVDPGPKTASVAGALTHPRKLLAATQGNGQTLPDGGALVGWARSAT
jgi:hypothetical protein